ncbi:MAG: hypothetical protein JY451_10145 [Erythrobacter sp.]|nr:MAG: hypothetical protein JY451_10145 [Erythrobacter sp.]
MKIILSATAALAIAMSATPACAQVLGGIGGGGGLGGALDTTIGGVDRTVRSTTGGAFETRGSTRGRTRVDRREGRVEAERRADASVTGEAEQLLSSPLGDTSAQGSGSGSASGQGSASAQLIGTDAVRETTAGIRSTATGTVASARGTASRVARSAGGIPSVSGGASGESEGSGNGSADLAGQALAVAGSGAASGNGVFGVSPGMPVLSPDGRQIGEVRQIVADRRGRVESLLVSAGDGRRMVPAGNFTAAGNGLIMGSGEAGGTTGSTAEPEEESNQ